MQTWRIDELDAPQDKLRCPTAVSISLVAQSLMRYKGFTRFEHYGWDACYMDGKHHANDQPDVGGVVQTFTIQDEAGKVFYSVETSAPWLAELHDAKLQAFNLHTMGYEIVVHGTGAVANLLKITNLAKTPDLP